MKSAANGTVAGDFPTTAWADKVALADLWTIRLASGTVRRWTSADVPISANGFVFTLGPIIKRGGTRITSAMDVDALDVTFETGDPLTSAAVTVDGVTLPHAAANGALDGAAVKLERAFMPDWGDVAATVHLFEGTVAGVEPRHTGVTLQVKSLLAALDSKWPRNIYQPACNHQLYGAGCGVNRAAHEVRASAGAGGTKARVPWELGPPGNRYAQGAIAFTSGANVGARRTVKASDEHGLDLSLPLPAPVQQGDAFAIVPACSKAMHDDASGALDPRPPCARYGALNRFRGFPFVPKPETAR